MKANRIAATALIACCTLMLQVGCQEEAATPQRLDPSWFNQFEIPAEQALPMPMPMPPTFSQNIKQPEPRIKFDKLVHNFGNVGLKTQNLCEFRFTNTGDSILTIGQIVASCGSCTAMELDKGQYAPGESGVMKVKFYSDTQPGLVTKNLTVHTNDRTNPSITLAVTATVLSKIVFEPAELSLLLNQENAGCPTITLTSTDGQPFSISHFISSSDCITIDYNPSVKAMKFVLEPKIDMARLADNLNGRIEIGLTHPECKTVTMGLKTIPRFGFRPVLARGAKPNVAMTKKVLIINNYNENFAISSVSSVNGTAKAVGISSIGNGYELDIEITPPESKNTRLFTDTLIVKTGTGDRLEIPCNVFYSAQNPRAAEAAKKEGCPHCGPRVIYGNGEIKARDF